MPKLKTRYQDKLEGATHRQYTLAKKVASHGVSALILKQRNVNDKQHAYEQNCCKEGYGLLRAMSLCKPNHKDVYVLE